MSADTLFHIVMLGFVAGSLVACGIAATCELYLASDYHQWRKREARRNRRAKAFLKRERMRARYR